MGNKLSMSVVLRKVVNGKDGTNGKDGADGTNAIRLDLDNENDSMLYDGAGSLVSAEVTSQATLYDGATAVDADDVEWSYVGNMCTVKSFSKGKVVVSSTATTGYVTVKATYKGVTYTAVLTIKKLVGVDKYDLVLSASQVVVDGDTNKVVSPTDGIKIYVYRTAQNGARTLVSSLSPYKVKLYIGTTEVTSGYNSVYSLSTPTSDTTVKLTDEKGTTTLDSETIPVVKDGKTGEKGDDAVTYEMEVSPSTIPVDGNGYARQDITVTVYKSVGNTRSVPTDIRIEAKFNGSEDMGDSGTNPKTLDFDGNKASDVTIKVYKTGSSDVLLERVVPIVNDGVKGLDGCISRVRTWTSGYEYRNDSANTSGTKYLDIVVEQVGENAVGNNPNEIKVAYRCLKTHDADATTKPGEGANWTDKWEQLSDFGSLYTPLLLANNATFYVGQTNTLYITNDEGGICGGIGNGKGNGCPLWFGGSTPDSEDTKFKVDSKGNLTATGTITATSGKIGGLAIGDGSLTDYSGTASVIDQNGLTIISNEKKGGANYAAYIRSDSLKGRTAAGGSPNSIIEVDATGFMSRDDTPPMITLEAIGSSYKMLGLKSNCTITAVHYINDFNDNAIVPFVVAHGSVTGTSSGATISGSCMSDSMTVNRNDEGNYTVTIPFIPSKISASDVFMIPVGVGRAYGRSANYPLKATLIAKTIDEDNSKMLFTIELSDDITRNDGNFEFIVLCW